MTKSTLKIGWATGSITPDKPVNLFGMFNERISTHVEDPCMASVLAMEGVGGEQAIWISCDLVNVSLEVVQDVRQTIAGQISELDPDKVLISCTHTHNAPNFRGDLFPKPPADAMSPEAYRSFFIERVGELAVQAWTARESGQVSPALGHAVIGWCRRVVFADGSGQMYGDAKREDFVRVEGPMDPGIELLFTHDMEGNPTGAVVSIACTPQTCMGEKFLTADFWGPTRRNLRQHFGDQFTILPIAGAAGDQCPDDLIRWGRSEPKLRGVDACAKLARRLTNGVIEGYENGRRDMTGDLIFRHIHTVFELPAYVMSDEQVVYYEEQIATLADDNPDPKSWNGGTLLRYRKLLERDAAAKANPILSTDCNFLRIGDFAVATNPFELYLEYGQRIKARCPATQTIAAQLTNDCLSYLPTRDALAHGHYSAMPASLRVPPEGGDTLVEQSLKVLESLFE